MDTNVNTHCLDKNVSDLVINSLLGFWSELLGVSNIDLDDSFFYLGADSITVLKLLFRIQQTFNVCLHYKDIFANPTLNSQALLIRHHHNQDYYDCS